MLLCLSGVIGLWSIGFFSPELINDVIGRALRAEGIALAKQPGYRTMWVGINMIIQNIGGFFGILVFTKLASRYGRKPTFAPVSYTHLRAHETPEHLVCRLLLE